MSDTSATDSAPRVEQNYRPEVPNFMRLGSIPVSYLQKLETDLLEPVIFQEGSGESVDGFVRFQLQQKGFLHSHSKIFVSLTPPAAVTRAIYPPNIGVGSVVKKAVLKVGNKVLNEISDWDYLHAFHSTKISNENNVERELYTTGRYMSEQFDYEDSTSVAALGVSVMTSREAVISAYGTDHECRQMPVAVMEGTHPEESPSYAIDLSDLFPFLKVHQLPLYMMSEPVTIELTLRPPVGNRAVRLTGTTDQSFVIDRNEMKFCADYIYYGASDEMERYAEANKVITFPFVDYRAVSTTVSQASLQSDTVRNLGMASRLVSKVITMFNDGSRADEDDLLLGTGSLSPATTNGQPNGFSYNIRYNDRFEFSSNVTNLARLFSLLQRSEQMVFVSRDQFSSQGGGFDGGTANTFEDFAQTDFQGQFFFNSTKLTGGRVGTRGIELHLRSDLHRAEVDTLRNFCEYMRSASLEGGRVDVYNL